MPCPGRRMRRPYIKSTENKKYGSGKATPCPEIIPAEVCPHVEYCKGDKDHQSDDFLYYFQLRKGEFTVSHPVCRHLQQVLEKRYPPRDQYCYQPVPCSEVAQVRIPGKRHEDIRDYQKNDCSQTAPRWASSSCTQPFSSPFASRAAVASSYSAVVNERFIPSVSAAIWAGKYWLIRATWVSAPRFPAIHCSVSPLPAFPPGRTRCRTMIPLTAIPSSSTRR